jgi:hypothetical protein
MKKVLRSLGYREMCEGLYGKPFAYNLFCFKLKELEFVNVVNGKNDEVLIWNKELYEDEFEEINFREFIKYCESFSHIEPLLKSDFQFLSRIEELEMKLYEK